MYSVRDFKAGARVELHPGLDLWMSGARFGSVVKVGRTRVHVLLDLTGTVAQIAPDRLNFV